MKKLGLYGMTVAVVSIATVVVGWPNDAACSSAIQTNETQIDDACFVAGNTQADVEYFFRAMAAGQCPM